MIERDLFNTLVEEVVAVDGRVYPNIMPQNCVKPSMVYTIISEIDRATMSGWCSDSSKIRIQIDLYAEDYAQTKEIKESIKIALKSFKHPVSSITNRDGFEPDTELYREIIECTITKKMKGKK